MLLARTLAVLASAMGLATADFDSRCDDCRKDPSEWGPDEQLNCLDLFKHGVCRNDPKLKARGESHPETVTMIVTPEWCFPTKPAVWQPTTTKYDSTTTLTPKITASASTSCYTVTKTYATPFTTLSWKTRSTSGSTWSKPTTVIRSTTCETYTKTLSSAASTITAPSSTKSASKAYWSTTTVTPPGIATSASTSVSVWKPSSVKGSSSAPAHSSSAVHSMNSTHHPGPTYSEPAKSTRTPIEKPTSGATVLSLRVTTVLGALLGLGLVMVL